MIRDKQTCLGSWRMLKRYSLSSDMVSNGVGGEESSDDEKGQAGGLWNGSQEMGFVYEWEESRSSGTGSGRATTLGRCPGGVVPATGRTHTSRLVVSYCCDADKYTFSSPSLLIGPGDVEWRGRGRPTPAGRVCLLPPGDQICVRPTAPGPA